MKKLLIAISAVTLGLVANAAALNWSTWGYSGTDPDDGDAWITGGQAYLVMVTDAASFAVDDSLAVTGGSIVDSAAFDGGTATGAWNDTSALSDGSTYYFAIIATTAGSSSAVPSSGFYAVDMNGDTGTASGFYEVTWNANTGVTFAADDDFAGVSMSTAVGGEPIPEPTSGLLMVLGMAGLALRRRRA